MKNNIGDIIQNSKKYQTPNLEWKFNFWLNFLPFILGFVLLFYPELQTVENLRNIRWFIGIILLVFPFVFAIIVWTLNLIIVYIRRGKSFLILVDNYEQISNEYSQFRNQVSSRFIKFISQYSFEVQSAHCSDQKIYITGNNAEGSQLEQGSIIVLYNTISQLTIGFFKVTTIIDSNFHAIALAGLDPLWEGNVRQKQNIEFLPNTCALLYPEGE